MTAPYSHGGQRVGRFADHPWSDPDPSGRPVQVAFFAMFVLACVLYACGCSSARGAAGTCEPGPYGPPVVEVPLPIPVPAPPTEVPLPPELTEALPVAAVDPSSTDPETARAYAATVALLVAQRDALLRLLCAVAVCVDGQPSDGEP